MRHDAAQAGERWIACKSAEGWAAEGGQPGLQGKGEVCRRQGTCMLCRLNCGAVCRGAWPNLRGPGASLRASRGGVAPAGGSARRASRQQRSMRQRARGPPSPHPRRTTSINVQPWHGTLQVPRAPTGGAARAALTW